MDKKQINNLKIIYGIDLILFGVVLACSLFIKGFNFNDYWFLFLVLPSLADIVLNKINSFNISLFILSTSLLGYFIFNNVLISLVVLVISIGLCLIFSSFLVVEDQNKKENKE